MRPERIFRTSDKPLGKGPVLYWMDRDLRLKDNWALIHADTLAKERGEQLIIVYNLVPTFLGGTSRQLSFKLGALAELQKEAGKIGIYFKVLIDETGTETPSLLKAFVEKEKISVVVTDFSPLRIQRTWKERVASMIEVPLVEVDAHNIVPVTVASGKLEFAAYTLRPKLHRLLPDYLEEFPTLSKRSPVQNETVDIAHKENPTRFVPGETAAKKALVEFIDKRLPCYASLRNDALADGQSDLSPYLHYGMLSAARVALLVTANVGVPVEKLLHASRNKAKVEEGQSLSLIDHAGAFLEELIVRRELSDNFCLYQPSYDSYEGFPEWAKRSHEAHRKDTREYLYTLEEFEEARTHDALWNAAQREMVDTGKMHGYMRMYWAKKILEWTPSPEEAMRIAVLLNDRYELDGRDPNGYAGIAWSIGGVHDRAWFTRPVYGQIRYMARSGADKKFDTDAYIEKFSQPRML